MQNVNLRKPLTVNQSFEAKALTRILLVFVGMVVFAALFSKGVFLQPANLVNLGIQNAILAVVALGQLLIILTGGIDLSIGGILALSSVSIVLYQDMGLIPALGVAFAIALLFGIVNGGLVTFVKLPSFVVTLGVMQIAYSLAKVMSKGGAVYTGTGGAPIAPPLFTFYKGTLLGIPYPILFAGAMLILLAVYLRTSIGHFTYPVGGNERAAYLSGIPVWLVMMAVYVISALLAAVGGALFVSRVGMGDPQTGQWLALTPSPRCPSAGPAWQVASGRCPARWSACSFSACSTTS